MSLGGVTFWPIKKKQELNKVKNSTRLEVDPAGLERSHTKAQKESGGLSWKGKVVGAGGGPQCCYCLRWEIEKRKDVIDNIDQTSQRKIPWNLFPGNMTGCLLVLLLLACIRENQCPTSQMSQGTHLPPHMFPGPLYILSC